MALIVVTGSPGCGKSTWVRTVAKPGDLRFGTDEITNVLTGKTEAKHHHGNTQKKISRAARDAGIAEAIKHRNDIDVYILVSNLNREDEQKWRSFGARFVIIDPGYDTAMQRCVDHRPGYKRRLVDAWYSRRDEWPRDAEIITGFQPPGHATQDDDDPDLPSASRAQLQVVTGPPAAGKSTFVRENRKPGDVTVDYDEIANVLAGLEPANHAHEPHIKAITKAARQAAIDTALKQAGDHRVWLIHSSPAESTLARYRDLGAQVHVIDPGKDVVMKRVKAQRPPHLLRVAAAWYDQRKPPRPKGTTERGYGWRDHQRPREMLLRQLKAGEPCWWCGLPMHREKTLNWDKKALAADHPDKDGAKQGQAPTRLLHFTCNSQAQGHENDHRRPAVTGRHPSEPLAEEPAAGGFQFGGVTFA